MSSPYVPPPGEPSTLVQSREEPIQAEFVDEDFDDRPTSGRRFLPLVLFLLTCFTTYSVGGFAYAFPLLTILLCHEFGHYLQARRYHVPASLPYFIPIPAPPLGTMGAVIGMRGNMGNRKALFDIGISGPLAGLGPALICCVVGLYHSQVVSLVGPRHGMELGEPLIFKLLSYWIFGPLPSDVTVGLSPLAYAGWVGVFITALNLMPIGQLDGGHVLYALLRRKAYPVTTGLLVLAVAGVIYTGTYQWSLMLALLFIMGPNHPPTADDNVPLGTPRIILGWLTLCFVIIGFTPTPFLGL